MHITNLPVEVIDTILTLAAQLNEQDGVQFTFGLTQPPGPFGAYYAKKPNRYVRGAVPPPLIKMDATASLRSVCSQWHQWGLDYALRDLYVKCWRGSERWCELTLQRSKYRLYEMIGNFKGEKVYRDPYSSLRQTQDLVATHPGAASAVRRLWFDGLYVGETNAMILSTVTHCVNLQSVTLPWTMLRQNTAADWSHILRSNSQQPLRSLEILAVELSSKHLETAQQISDQTPLSSARVNFSKLRRLKLFGDTTFMPITDADLMAMARTTTHLKEFQVTCMSTISIQGVMAIVKSSQRTLHLLEYSPRSMSGFYHSNPGFCPDDQHACEILTQCHQLRDLSISLPSMCPILFSNSNVKWRGECQVRSLYLCGHIPEQARTLALTARRSSHTRPRPTLSQSQSQSTALARTLAQARQLSLTQAQSTLPTCLSLELFFASCIFEPHRSIVHGDFGLAEMVLGEGIWPMEKWTSRKGAYGSTGVYGKEGEWEDLDGNGDGKLGGGVWDLIQEEEFLRGVEAGYFSL